MSNFISPRQQFLNDSGLPLAGGYLYFYVAGTTTFTNVYSNVDLTIPQNNPVHLDAAGRMPDPVFVKSNLVKVRLEDSLNNLIWEEDNIIAVNLTSTLQTQLTSIQNAFKTPYSEGGVGDGLSNDAAAVQASFDSTAGTVDLAGAVWKCNSPLTLRSNLIVQNGTLDFSSLTGADVSFITGSGTVGNTVNLTANALLGALTLTVTSTAGLSSGDVILISSQANYGPTFDCGEVVEVLRVDNATQLTLASKLRHVYNIADTAFIRRVIPISNVRFRNVTIVGTTPVSFADLRTGIDLTYARNCEFNVDFQRVFSHGFRLKNCLRVSVSGSYTYAESLNDAVWVQCFDACKDIKILEGRLLHARHAMRHNNTPSIGFGVAYGLEVNNLLGTGCRAAVIAGEQNAGDITVRHARINFSDAATGASAFRSYANRVVVEDSELIGPNNGLVIWQPTPQASTNNARLILSNVLVSQPNGAPNIDIAATISTPAVASIRLSNCNFITTDTVSLNITGNTDVNEIDISDCNFDQGKFRLNSTSLSTYELVSLRGLSSLRGQELVFANTSVNRLNITDCGSYTSNTDPTGLLITLSGSGDIFNTIINGGDYHGTTQGIYLNKTGDGDFGNSIVIGDTRCRTAGGLHCLRVNGATIVYASNLTLQGGSAAGVFLETAGMTMVWGDLSDPRLGASLGTIVDGVLPLTVASKNYFLHARSGVRIGRSANGTPPTTVTQGALTLNAAFDPVNVGAAMWGWMRGPLTDQPLLGILGMELRGDTGGITIRHPDPSNPSIALQRWVGFRSGTISAPSGGTYLAGDVCFTNSGNTTRVYVFNGTSWIS